MRIEIRSTTREPDGGVSVEFACTAGVASGHWQGRSVRAGMIKQVEIEFDEALRWGENVRASTEAAARIEAGPDGVKVVALAEHAWPDGVVALRLGEGLIAASVDGIPPGANVWLEVRARSISVYDESL